MRSPWASGEAMRRAQIHHAGCGRGGGLCAMAWTLGGTTTERPWCNI